MGVYAQTSYTIECENKETAEKVKAIIEKMNKDDITDNNFGTDLFVGDIGVDGIMSSGRIQNLEWRCEQIWNAVKDIDGVIEMNCPFLSETDGMYFSRENEEEFSDIKTK